MAMTNELVVSDFRKDVRNKIRLHINEKEEVILRLGSQYTYDMFDDVDNEVYEEEYTLPGFTKNTIIVKALSDIIDYYFVYDDRDNCKMCIVGISNGNFYIMDDSYTLLETARNSQCTVTELKRRLETRAKNTYMLNVLGASDLSIDKFHDYICSSDDDFWYDDEEYDIFMDSLWSLTDKEFLELEKKCKDTSKFKEMYVNDRMRLTRYLGDTIFHELPWDMTIDMHSENEIAIANGSIVMNAYDLDDTEQKFRITMHDKGMLNDALSMFNDSIVKLDDILMLTKGMSVHPMFIKEDFGYRYIRNSVFCSAVSYMNEAFEIRKVLVENYDNIYHIDIMGEFVKYDMETLAVHLIQDFVRHQREYVNKPVFTNDNTDGKCLAVGIAEMLHSNRGAVEYDVYGDDVVVYLYHIMILFKNASSETNNEASIIATYSFDKVYRIDLDIDVKYFISRLDETTILSII